MTTTEIDCGCVYEHTDPGQTLRVKTVRRCPAHELEWLRERNDELLSLAREAVEADRFPRPKDGRSAEEWIMRLAGLARSALVRSEI